MTLVTLRPDATTQVTGTVVINNVAASPTLAHQALADELDTSFVSFGVHMQGVWVTFADLALPVGAAVRSVTLRARHAAIGRNAAYLVAQGTTVQGKAMAPTGYALVMQAEALTTTVALDLTLGDPDVDVYSCVFYRYGGRPGNQPLVLFAAYLDVVVVEKPLLVVDAPASLIDNNLPEISWTPTLAADGGLQTHYRVRVFSAAQYSVPGFDPATSAATADSDRVRSSGTVWQLTAPLPDATYRAYVMVSQDFRPGTSHNSNWEYTQFEVVADKPGVPVLMLTAQPLSGRVEIAVSDSAGDATTDAVEVQRSADDGVTWEPIRLATGLGGRVEGTAYPVVLYDHEAPNGQPLTYRARALHNYSGVWAATAWVITNTAWSSPSWWIKHPHRPDLNVALELTAYGAITRAARQGVFQPLGASLPIVVSDTRAGAAGQITVRVDTTVELDALDKILATTATLLLQGPRSAGEPDRYVRFGDSTSARLLEMARRHQRNVTLPWVEVVKPAGPKPFSWAVLELEQGEAALLLEQPAG